MPQGTGAGRGGHGGNIHCWAPQANFPTLAIVSIQTGRGSEEIYMGRCQRYSRIENIILVVTYGIYVQLTMTSALNSILHIHSSSHYEYVKIIKVIKAVSKSVVSLSDAMNLFGVCEGKYGVTKPDRSSGHTQYFFSKKSIMAIKTVLLLYCA